MADGTLTYNWQDPEPTANSPHTDTASDCSADNPTFAVKAVHEFVKMGGDIGLFKDHSHELERVMNTMSLSKNHLVRDDIGPYVYGFYDTVTLSGEECFASVLFYDAALRMSAMFKMARDPLKAADWCVCAQKTRDGLQNLLLEDEGMFLSDTGTNRQIDVWGSSYAVYAGMLSKHEASRVSAWLVSNHERCLRRGHVRHIPSPAYWKGAFTDVVYPAIERYGNYQNGGYWSVPAPWVAHAIALTDRSLAQRMVCDLTESLIDYGAPECINEDDSCRLPGYAASAAMGRLAIRPFTEGGSAETFGSKTLRERRHQD